MTTDPLLVDAAVARSHSLTERQLEVLTRVAQGQTNAQIGRALLISDGVVKLHLRRLFHRLQVVDRASAVATAYDVGVFRTRAQRQAEDQPLEPRMTTCTDCGERQSSDAGRHLCTALDNRTGWHIGDPVVVGQAPGQIVQLQVVGDSGMAKVYFKALFRGEWYLTGQLERSAA